MAGRRALPCTDPEGSNGAFSAGRILVIDDERMIGWSIAHTLRPAGYEVAVAETAAEGMTLFRRFSPDVVFLDIRLPDADGLTGRREIKREQGRDTAVVVMTAGSRPGTAAGGPPPGAFRYLEKPFDFTQLEALVREAVGCDPAAAD